MNQGLFQVYHHCHLSYKIRRRLRKILKIPSTTKSNGVGKSSCKTYDKLLDQFLLIHLIIATLIYCTLQPAHAAPRPVVDWPSKGGKMTERSNSYSETASHFNHLQTSHPFLQKTQMTKDGNLALERTTTTNGLPPPPTNQEIPSNNSNSMVLTVSDSISSGGSNASQPNQSSAVTQPLSFSRKVKVLAFILGCCCMVAIIVNFINLHSDYEELQEFYLGFMGRKMLIQEKRLTSKTYLKLLRRAQLESIENDCFMEITEAFQQQSSSAKSPKNSTNCNGHSMQQGYCDGEISFIPLQERGISIKDGITLEATPPSATSATQSSTSRREVEVTMITRSHPHRKKTPSTTMTTLTSNSRYRDILGPSPLPRKSRPNMSVIVMQQPQVAAAAAAASSNSTANLVQESEIEPQFDGSEEWLLPLLAKEYIEDHDVEWRDLDYSSDVGPPPTSFCLFICQYDCRIFPDRMTEREAERRKNLLHHFRLWKLLKRKHYNIVVTERAKKEMADRDQDQMRR